MSWVQNLRNQPHEKKIRIIWICAGITVVIMLIVWAATWHYRKEVPRDTTLFNTVEQGVKGFKNNYNKPIK